MQGVVWNGLTFFYVSVYLNLSWRALGILIVLLILGRNQRMTEDQSVLGRRRIYYDPTGGEALICSDSEEEVIEEEEDKKEFVRSEDYILRLV